MDIVKLATQRATPQLLSQVVGLAGAHPDQVQKGLGAAVSAIMAGILGACRKPEAATAFGTALSRAGGLNDLLAKDPAVAASTGWEALAPLLGAGAARPLSAALAGHAGLPKAAAGKLLGLAAAMVLGTLGNEAADKGLDATGTLGLMQGQKDAITGALPIDLARALGTLDLLDGVSAPQPARPAIDLMQPSLPPRPSRRGERVKWVAGLILLAAVVWFGLRLFAPAPVVETAPATTAATLPRSADPLVVSGIDVGADVEAALDSIITTFGEITDADSAKIAMPKLVVARDRLNAIEDAVDSLHEDGRAALKGIIEGRLPTIQQDADRLLTDPNVAAQVKPVIDDILAQLTAFSA